MLNDSQVLSACCDNNNCKYFIKRRSLQEVELIEDVHHRYYVKMLNYVFNTLNIRESSQNFYQHLQ